MRVVGDNTKSSVGGISLHNPTKGHLRSGRHGVCFIEDDELERSE